VTDDDDPPPPPPPDGCDDYEFTYSGSLSGTGDYDIQPNGSYFYWPTSGTHAGCLDGPGSADFDLYLQRWSGGWVTVASSTSPDSEEELTYNGSPGYYRYVVYSYSGSGSYTLGIDVP
jgi:streptogrisin C